MKRQICRSMDRARRHTFLFAHQTEYGNYGYAPSTSQLVPKWTRDRSASGCPRNVECIRIETGDAERVGRLSSEGQLTYAPKPQYGRSIPVDRGRAQPEPARPPR